MTYLQEDQSDRALTCLRQAQALSLSANDREGTIVTLNNLACFYRRRGQLDQALKYLQQALTLTEHCSDSSKADTHLNLCAISSEMGKHRQARMHVQHAISLLQEELFHQACYPLVEQLDRLTILILAYHKYVLGMLNNTGTQPQYSTIVSE